MVVIEFSTNFVAVPQIGEWRVSGGPCDRVLVQRVNETRGWSPNGQPMGVHINPDDSMLRRLTDGPQTVGCTLALTVYDRPRPVPTAAGGGYPPMSIRPQVVMEVPWVLLPAGESSVTLVTPPDAAVEVARAFQVLPRGLGPEEIAFDLMINNPAVHVAGSVVLRIDDREWPMGTVLVSKGIAVTRRFTRTLWPGDESALARSAHVDVVIRPDPRPAALTVDVWAIWGRDIVIPIKPAPPAKAEEAALPR